MWRPLMRKAERRRRRCGGLDGSNCLESGTNSRRSANVWNIRQSSNIWTRISEREEESLYIYVRNRDCPRVELILKIITILLIIFLGFIKSKPC